MRKILLIAVFFIANHALFAQDYFTGKLTGPDGASSLVYYDRTQFLVNSSVHQTRYKVLDANKKNLCVIYITHDQQRATISFSINVTGAVAQSNIVNYDRQKCGLVFCDAGNTDTVFAAATAYNYLVSFSDTLRDYPVLHKLKIADQQEIELDPLSRMRVKKHNELVRKFQVQTTYNVAKAEQIVKESSVTYGLLNDTFNAQLFTLRDSLYAENSEFIEIITKMRSHVEADMAASLKDNRIYSDEERYGGEEKNGKPQGKGVLVSDGNVYDGTFARGAFVSGTAVIKSKDATYSGEYVKDTMCGQGWLKYNNGSFYLGVFKGGKLNNGISLWKENGEVFFGSFKNSQRTGYGELRNSRGDSYYGEFLNGRLVKGYCKEVDQFGYSTYSRIENGKKATVAAQLAEAFFDSIHTIKQKAETQP